MAKATPSRNPNRSSSPAEPLKWGILATGDIAKRFVGDLHASKAGHAVACGSRTVETARTFASAYGIPKAYGSYGELARDPEVEAVYVATPHHLHFEDALACLRHGKAVLCEKPMTVASEQTAALFEAARENGVFLMEGLWTFFLPALIQVKKWCAEGAIGEVKWIQADLGFAKPADPQLRWYNPALAGGALLDVGVYPLSLAQWLVGNKPPKIKASAQMASTGVDESISMLLDWHSGVHAHLSGSIGLDTRREARIYGSRGTITVEDFWTARKAVLCTDEETLTFEDRRTTHGYDFEARAMTQAIRNGLREDPVLSEPFSVRLASTVDAIRKQIGLTYPFDPA